MSNLNCIFCGSPSECFKARWDCPNCGSYLLDHESSEDLPAERKFIENRYLLSGYIREMNGYNEVPAISYNNYLALLSHSIIPTRLLQKIEKLIQYTYQQTSTLYQMVPIPRNPSIAYCHDENELMAVICAAGDMELLMPNDKAMIGAGPINRQLTIKGLEKAEELRKYNPVTKQGFVAMWFDDAMIKTFEEYIASGIQEAGYQPFIIPMKEHNDDITDHIIAEIRRSKFVVADFTGHRGGVYFEAGFAYGLGLPVIWTCREDWFNPAGDAARKIHFDVDHYNFIVWKDGEDLKQKLINRIRATVI